MKKTKPETDSLLRVPKAKNKLGLKITQIRMPHEDLIKPEHHKLELVNDTMTSHTRQSTQPSHTSVTRHARQVDIAPIKDFQKVPNSITKAAIPDGLFKQGKSKHLYDVLYSLTRGSIEPRRAIRLSKIKLRKLAGIGSRVTFDSCVSHLVAVGLLKLTLHIGEHEGNEFEVFLPEEITLTRHTRQSSQSSHAQKLDILDTLEDRQTRQSSSPIDIEVVGMPKTSLKTNTKNDDEPFGAMIDELKQIGKGKSESWRSLAELLRMEFEIAAARTKSVSNAPAFLTEHLRRRLIGKSEAPKTHSKKLAQVGIQQPSEPIETYQPEPLTDQGRESTLSTFAGYIEKGQKEFLMGLQDTYTTDDWQWLMKQLKLE